MSGDERTCDLLVDEREALALYFEALLQPEALPEAPPEAPPVAAAGQAGAASPAPAPAASVPVADWGREPFQAMLFKVAGLTLAVPLIELSGVQEWSAEQLTPMPGHQPWYLGLIQYRGRSVPVVDTAALVLPADRLARVAAGPEARLQRIVFIDDGAWGLACDEVAEVITLTPDAVRWRTSRTRRHWLAGTVIEQMCALIDPPAFARMLVTGNEDLTEPMRSDDAGA